MNEEATNPNFLLQGGTRRHQPSHAESGGRWGDVGGGGGGGSESGHLGFSREMHTYEQLMGHGRRVFSVVKVNAFSTRDLFTAITDHKKNPKKNPLTINKR